MTFTIAKEFAWSSSHVLHGLPYGHQCGRLHGHNYVARVVLTADRLDATGFVHDYGLLAPIKRLVDDVLDHRHLNDVPGLEQPTAEHLAVWLYDQATEVLEMEPHVRIAAIEVCETPKTWARYEP